jgi:hydroxymethylbilane synthase
MAKNCTLGGVPRKSDSIDMPNLIIGSRGSALALWQSNWVKSQLESLHEGLTVEIEIIRTTGDKLQAASLVKIAGKGVFTKEIEEALLERRVDLAVHSLKDLPTTLPDGLHIAAVTKREDPRDALIVHASLVGSVRSLLDLPAGARVGTSSPRRAAQLRRLRPDFEILELRGNVETRLKKLDAGDYDAIILAAAGLARLGFSGRITERVPTDVLLSAVGQGALGIESCVDDERTNFLLEGLNHWPTRNAVEAERAVLRGLGGGCAVPIAAFGQVIEGAEGSALTLEALVIDLAGTRAVRESVTGSQYKSDELGSLLARHLIAAGAHEILREFREQRDESGTIELGAQRESDDSPQDGGRDESSDGVKADEQAPTEAEAQSEAEAAPARPEPATRPAADIPDLLVEIKPAPPALPLAGKRVIITRARHQADALAHSLESYGAEVIACPTIDIREPENWESLDRALTNLHDYQWLAFTSTNGVDYFLRRMDALGRGRAELTQLKVCAVGRKTSERLKEERVRIDLMPERFTAEALVEAFIKRYGVGQRLRGARMLLPAARPTRDVVRPALARVGVDVDVVEAYQNVVPETTSQAVQTLINAARADYVIFTSPSTVQNLALLLETDNLAAPLKHTRVACIGPVTAEAAERCGLKVHIQPAEHTARAIVQALVADARR